MACAFKENTCQIGVIVGTGSNACYMEKLSRCEKLKDLLSRNDGLPDEVNFLRKNSKFLIKMAIFVKSPNRRLANSWARLVKLINVIYKLQYWVILQMIINMEWGAFGDDGALDFVRTRFDIEVDNSTINAGKQLYEFYRSISDKNKNSFV